MGINSFFENDIWEIQFHSFAAKGSSVEMKVMAIKTRPNWVPRSIFTWQIFENRTFMVWKEKILLMYFPLKMRTSEKQVLCSFCASTTNGNFLIKVESWKLEKKVIPIKTTKDRPLSQLSLGTPICTWFSLVASVRCTHTKMFSIKCLQYFYSI